MTQNEQFLRDTQDTLVEMGLSENEVRRVVDASKVTIAVRAVKWAREQLTNDARWIANGPDVTDEHLMRSTRKMWRVLAGIRIDNSRYTSPVSNFEEAKQLLEDVGFEPPQTMKPFIFFAMLSGARSYASIMVGNHKRAQRESAATAA